MSRFVLDASVIVKWVVQVDEPDAERALALLASFEKGEVEFLEPPHYLAEVAAVLTRLCPERARSMIDALYELNRHIDLVDSLEAYQVATALASKLNHHLFDTLYHAVALIEDVMLITADERYYHKAASMGAVIRLSDL